MKFDNIIIGGGLSGLVSGIAMARKGMKTAIVSAGQSALHFWSGSFDLLGHDADGHTVERPFEGMKDLPDSHPYKKIGELRLRSLLGKVVPLLSEAGISLGGDIDRNHYRLTPMGYVRPAWLTLDDYLTFNHPENLPWRKLAIVNIRGYVDFYPRFLAYGLEKKSVACTIHSIDIPQIDSLRKSTTEMRATNMARTLKDDAVDALAREINKATAGTGADAVVMPAILGMFSDKPVIRLREKTDLPVFFIATTPASVPGVRCQLGLREYFTRLGGIYLPGDTVLKGEIRHNRLERIYTANFEDMPLDAGNFVISTGSFFGHGLIATIDRIYEPALGLDVLAGKKRSDWYDKDIYKPQPFMDYGVTTDDRFRPSYKGETVENLYATGALLSGFNAIKEASGAGITLATALSAAENIAGEL